MFSFSLLILVTSCQKDPSADIRPEAACKLIKAYYFDETGAIADSLVYTYTGNKITKGANADGYVTFDYTNDRITKRTIYDAGSPELDTYDVITYTSDGKLKNIKKYYNFTNQTIPAEQYDFIYSGNKLEKLDVSYYDPIISQYELYETTAFTYTGENITRSITTQAIGGGLKDTFNYAHDANKNYFTKSNAFLIDLSFFEEIAGEAIPLFMSSNNVINIFEGGDEFPLSYKPDDKENLFEWYFEGNLASRYLYDCK